MVAGNRPSSLGLPPGQPLDHRHGGRLSSTTGELSIHGMGDDYTVEGNGTIKSLPTMPVGMTAFLRILGNPTFSHSTKLICENGADYVVAANDLVIARSDGDGVWRLYVLAASRMNVAPQGRLSLTTGVALTKSDVVGATLLYWVPYGGNYCPINGTPTLCPQLSNDSTQSSTGNAGPAAVLANSVYDFMIWNPGSGPVMTRSPPWTTTATVTMTIASPIVITWSGSDFDDGVPILFTTTGALETGLTAGTQYYVKRTGTDGTATATFNVAATVGGAAINGSGSQSGTHTGLASSDTGQGTGSGTAERSLNADGTLRNKFAVTNGPGAGLGTIVGSARTDGSGQFKDSVLFRWVSNIYNAKLRSMTAIDTSANYNYSANTWRRANGTSANKLDYLQAVDGNVLAADIQASYENSGVGAYGFVAIQVDTIASSGIIPNNRTYWNFTPTASAPVAVNAVYNAAQSMGRHRAYWTEINASNVGTATWVVNNSLGVQGGIAGMIEN